jgi:hypothetical protein
MDPYLLVFRPLPLVIDQIGVGELTELTAFGVFSLKIARYERQPICSSSVPVVHVMFSSNAVSCLDAFSLLSSCYKMYTNKQAYFCFQREAYCQYKIIHNTYRCIPAPLRYMTTN